MDNTELDIADAGRVVTAAKTLHTATKVLIRCSMGSSFVMDADR
jgi:hypothetical protein